MKRNTFVSAMLGIAAIGIAACTSVGADNTAAPAKKDIGFQLYSLRDLFKSDYATAVKTSGKIGFNIAEAAGYKDGKFYGKSPEQFKKDAEAAGMKVLSSHVSQKLGENELKTGDFTEVLKWWDTAIDAHKKLGVKFLILAYIPHKNMDANFAKRYADYLNAVGKKCANAGLVFGYHNHAFEFEKIDGKYLYDYFLENTDPKFVCFEMDVYWVVRGQNSPVDYLLKYPNRFRLLHLKDNRELGQSGMVGFDAIFKALPKTSVEGVIVEVEHYSFDPVKSCQISYDYLNNSTFVPASYK